MKKYLLTLFATLSFLMFTNAAFASQMMLFVLEGCSHCANVEKYMEDNQIASKLDIKIYELSGSVENGALYDQKAFEVGYTGGKVPFLVDGARYFVGDTGIISYMEDVVKNGEPQSVETQSITPEEPKKNPETLSDENQNQLKNILAENLPPPSWFNKNKTYVGIGILVIIIGVVAKLLFRIKKM